MEAGEGGTGALQRALGGVGHPSVGEVGLANYVNCGDATVPSGGSQAGVHLIIRYREDLALCVSGRHAQVEAISKAREVSHFAQIVRHLVWLN